MRYRLPEARVRYRSPIRRLWAVLRSWLRLGPRRINGLDTGSRRAVELMEQANQGVLRLSGILNERTQEFRIVDADGTEKAVPREAVERWRPLRGKPGHWVELESGRIVVDPGIENRSKCP